MVYYCNYNYNCNSNYISEILTHPYTLTVLQTYWQALCGSYDFLSISCSYENLPITFK